MPLGLIVIAKIPINCYIILTMKAKIHPQYYPKAKVTCACGNTFTTGSTVEEIHIEICSACHPFFTGKQKILDAAGRVERFKKRTTRTQEKVQRKMSAVKSKKAST